MKSVNNLIGRKWACLNVAYEEECHNNNNNKAILLKYQINLLLNFLSKLILMKRFAINIVNSIQVQHKKNAIKTKKIAINKYITI